MNAFKIVKSKEFYCVPASLETILVRYGINNWDQNRIAEYFSINTDYSSPQAIWGSIIKKDDINAFFINNSIGLREEFISVMRFVDEYFMVELIKKMLDAEISVICGYNYSSLFGDKKGDWGHVSIATNISDNFRNIELADPGPKYFGYKWVDACDLFNAIKARNDGLWCMSRA